MSQFRLLDLYSGAGGCARGYQLAGFHVTGVDNAKQPRYVGDKFVQTDALEYLAEHGREFDAVHASPPCQGYIKAKGYMVSRTDHPLLIELTRELLIKIGKPYVIESVMDAPLINPIILAGTLFDLKVLRQRKFECSFPVEQPAIPKFTGKVTQLGCKPRGDEFIAVVGHFSGVEYARTAMGIDWMTRDELAQAIPPAYTKWIGERLALRLGNRAVNLFVRSIHMRMREGE